MGAGPGREGLEGPMTEHKPPPPSSSGPQAVSAEPARVCRACGEDVPPELLAANPARGLCEACGDALAASQRGRRFGVCGQRGG